MHQHTAPLLCKQAASDPVLLEGVGDTSFVAISSPHPSHDAPDRLAAAQQSVK